MKNIVILAAVCAAATPAFAQDETNLPFNGPRIEARVGLDRPTISVEATDGIDTIEESEGKSGVAYGGEIGWDVAISSIGFIGAYAGIEASSTKECAEVFGGDEACLKAGRNISAGLRGGFMIGQNAGVYAKGGYSNGRLRVTYEDPAFPADDFDLGDNLEGFHLGAGVEVGMSSGAYGKIEYVYTDYSDYEYSDGTVGIRAGLTRHQVLAGIGFRF